MLQTTFIRKNKEAVMNSLRRRNFADEDLAIVDRVITLDDQRKALQTSNDNILADRNRLSAEIGRLFKSGQKEEATLLRTQVTALKEQLVALEQQLKSTIEELTELLYNIPNVAHESVPAGNTEEDNEVYKAWPKPLPDLFDAALPH